MKIPMQKANVDLRTQTCPLLSAMPQENRSQRATSREESSQKINMEKQHLPKPLETELQEMYTALLRT